MKIENKVLSLKNVSPEEYLSYSFNDLKDSKDRDVSKLMESIKKRGFTVPAMIAELPDITYVMDGTGRELAIKQLIEQGHEFESIPCVVIKAETLQEAKQMVLEINSRHGEITIDSFKGFADFDVDWSTLNMSEISIDDLIDDTPLPEDDAVPEAPEEPKSKLGDLYELGEHRVLCGDSTKIEDVEKLMNGQKADMVFTDPPYGMNLDTDYSKMGKSKTKYDKVIGDETDFDISFMFDLLPSPIYYIWGAEYLYDTIPNFKQGSLAVWAKRQSAEENKVFGSAYELCWVFPKIKKEIWFVRGINQSSERLGKHPTQKPTELGVKAINDRTEPENIVADLFLGSGSTLIASEKTNRKCYGMELDPKYVDVIVQRYVDYTGNTTIKKNGEDVQWEVSKKE